MTKKNSVGHWPTLVASFLHFDLSFMLWVLLGALGIYIAEGIKLNAAQKGLMVAIPILSGSLLRMPLGLLSDRFGSKRVGIGMLIFLFLPLLIGWQAVANLPSLLAVGIMLGTAGASFSVALPLASRWYPPERQGLVMGIAAAGNSGTVIANLLAPRLANILGWRNVLGLAMIPLAIVLIAFSLMAKDNPDHRTGQPISSHLRVLKLGDLWWFCCFYIITFGGYVGLSSFMPIFFRDQYKLSPITAGYLTALAAFVGSGMRPFGGYLADKLGGVRVLSVLLLAICGAYALESWLPRIGLMTVCLVSGMACLGMGNGAVFQLVPQCFQSQIGIVSGVVGALGGLGGFMLPTLLGNIKQATGSFSAGFLALAGLAFVATVLLRALSFKRQHWRLSWRVPQQAEALAQPGD
jgi:NNP family nitrate/nitrite transporter-like MFS transporter